MVAVGLHALGLLLPLTAWATTALAIGVGIWQYRRFELSQQVDDPTVPYEVTLDQEALTIPAWPGDPDPLVLPCADIDGVLDQRTRRGAMVIIETPQDAVRLDADVFESPDSLVRLITALNALIALRDPEGGRLSQIHSRSARARQVMRGLPRLTWLLLGALAMGYLAQQTLMLDSGQAAHVLLGANVPSLVFAGEWDRLVAANFLHGGLLHIGLNALALVALGRLIEILMGPWGLWSVFLLSSVTGALASTLVSEGLFSLGASTGLFGLLAALMVLQWRFSTQMPTGMRPSKTTWTLLLGANLALPFIIPIIDLAAHVGGFVGGGLICWLLIVGQTDLDRVGRQPRTVALGILSAVLCAVGLWQTSERLADPHHEIKATTAVRLAEAPLPDRGDGALHTWLEIINRLAYFTALDAKAPPSAHRQGLTAIRKVNATARARLAQAPDKVTFNGLNVTLSQKDWQASLAAWLDTEAALAWRLGQREVAQTRQLQALRFQAPLTSDGPERVTELTTRLVRMMPHGQGALDEAVVAEDTLTISAAPPKARLMLYRIRLMLGGEEPPQTLGLAVAHLTGSGPWRLPLAEGSKLPAQGVVFETLGPAPGESTPDQDAELVAPGYWRWWPMNDQTQRLPEPVVGLTAL